MHEVARLSPPVLKLEVLADIACGIARVEPLWRATAHHRPGERRPVRLLATEAYEVWVIGWTEGQGADMHDHGDSAGVLVVLEGSLTEEVPTADGPRTVGLLAGEVHPLPVGHVHGVSNRGAAPATSIHVYSPPLRTMRRYDPVTLTLLDEEPVVTEAAALPPALAAVFSAQWGRSGPDSGGAGYLRRWSPSRLLHPAGRGSNR